MTTSQMEVQTELPTVVVNCEQALLDPDGCVVAMVTWRSDDREVIYALDEESLALVPRLDGDINVADWVRDMRSQSRLVDYSHVVSRHKGVLLIDDPRSGAKHSYRVYGGEQLYAGSYLESGAVYYCFVDGGMEDDCPQPRLTAFHEVMGLALLPESVLISDVVMLSGWRHAVRVEDEYSIQASIDAARSA